MADLQEQRISYKWFFFPFLSFSFLSVPFIFLPFLFYPILFFPSLSIWWWGLSALQP
jgi:hypothetical protein